MASQYGLIKVQEILDYYKSEKDKYSDHESLKILTLIKRALDQLKFATPSMPIEALLSVNSDTLTASIPINATRIYGIGRILNNTYIPLIEGNLTAKAQNTEYTVGQDLGFGTVIKVLSNKYIVVANEDLGNYQFGKIYTSANKGVGYSQIENDFEVGIDELPRTTQNDGVFNTSLIIESAEEMITINSEITDINVVNSNYAAIKCAEYNGGGYKEWYLPSIDELREYLSTNFIEEKSFVSSTESSIPVSNAYDNSIHCASKIEPQDGKDVIVTVYIERNKTYSSAFVLPFLQLEKGITDKYTPTEHSKFDSNNAKTATRYKIFLDENVIRFSSDPERNLVIRYESNKFDNSAFIPELYQEAILAYIDWKISANMNEKINNERIWKEQIHLIQRHSLPSILRMYRDIQQEWRMSTKMDFRNDLY